MLDLQEDYERTEGESETPTFSMAIRAIAYAETVEEMIESRSKFTRKGLWENSTSKNTSAPQGTNKAIMAENNKDPKKKEEQNNKKETAEANKRSRNPYNGPFS